MPDINGWQAAKQIREKEFTQAIIVVSANVRDLEVSNTALGHHNDYLVKPFVINALLEKVGHWLGLTWLHETRQEAETAEHTLLDERTLAGKNQFTALKVLAEIGYLSGFTSKLNKINEEYALPSGTYQTLKDSAQLCQFQKIILTLDELINANISKSD